MVIKVVILLKMNEINSVKQKRNILSGLFKKVRMRYNVSCIELSDLDEKYFIKLGFVGIGQHYDQVHKMMDKIIGFIDQFYEFEIIDIEFTEY